MPANSRQRWTSFFSFWPTAWCTGAFYALSALGLTLVFGLMRVVNFAHGELYVIGGSIRLGADVVFGWNYFLALLASSSCWASSDI